MVLRGLLGNRWGRIATAINSLAAILYRPVGSAQRGQRSMGPSTWGGLPLQYPCRINLCFSNNGVLTVAWIPLLLLIAVVAWFFLRKSSQPANSPHQDHPEQATIAAPQAAPPSPVAQEPATIEDPVSEGSSITIGKNLPLPLTLSGLTHADAIRLAKGLEARDWSTRGWLTLLIARNNVRCEEIDAWVATARPKLESSIKKGIAASAEWATASELDKADILEEADPGRRRSS